MDSVLVVRKVCVVPKRSLSTCNLHSHANVYWWNFYHGTSELPPKISLYMSLGSEMNSVGFVNRHELKRFVLDSANAYLSFLRSTTYPQIDKRQFMLMQVNRLLSELRDYLVQNIK